MAFPLRFTLAAFILQLRYSSGMISTGGGQLQEYSFRNNDPSSFFPYQLI
jgi:hypothetical protein